MQSLVGWHRINYTIHILNITFLLSSRWEHLLTLKGSACNSLRNRTWWKIKCSTCISKSLKSQDIQKVVKTKYENGDGPAQIYRDLAEAVSFPTIKLWIKMMNTTGSTILSSSPGYPRTVRIKAAIVKVENRLNQKKRVSTRKLAKEINTSRRSIQRILCEALSCKPYKKTIQPKLTNLQKK